MSNLLSQGGYGCVYHPSISCFGNIRKSKKFVSKLQRNDWAASNEIEIGKLIKKIKDYELYFLPVTSSCEINLSNVDKNLLSDCNIVKKRPNSKFILMKMKYLENISFVEFFTSNTNKSNLMFSKLVETYLNINRSISILNENNIVHHDLKIDNILIGAQSLNPIIIDFGISMNMNNITLDDIDILNENFYIHSPDYYPWCIEIHIVNYIVQERFEDEFGNLTSIELREVAKEWVDGNIALDIVSNKFKKNFLEKTYNYVDQFDGMDKNEVINSILSTYKKWDPYSISIIFLKLLSFLYNKGFPNTNFISEFSELCLINLSPNPDDRLTCNDSIKYLYDIKSRESSLSDLDKSISLITANNKDIITSTNIKRRQTK